MDKTTPQQGRCGSRNEVNLKTYLLGIISSVAQVSDLWEGITGRRPVLPVLRECPAHVHYYTKLNELKKGCRKRHLSWGKTDD